jgi:hypothetical protein
MIKKTKYVTVDPENPNAFAVCDRSGFYFNHKDLHKQMEWRGNNLVWTGLLVGTPFLDIPNEQNRPPPIKADPIPVKNPRLTTPYIDPETFVTPNFTQLLPMLQDPVNNPPPPPLPDNQIEAPPVDEWPQLLQKLRQFNWGS